MESMASSIQLTGWMSIDERTDSRALAFFFGIIHREKPIWIASFTRASILGTPRTSPLKPTSPMTAVS